MTATKFEHLLSPIEFGGIKLKNRIVMPPMATNFATEEGYVTDRLKEHYEARAKGGVGLIIVEYTSIDPPTDKGVVRQVCCNDDSHIKGLSELVQLIHGYGIPIAIQFCHSGRLAGQRFTGRQTVAPSALAAPGQVMPREISRAEIDDIVKKYANAAARAQKAGFDGVEIHCAHGYLFHEFLSRAANIREDEYGGSLENRARFVLDTVRAVKEKVGPDYPVWARMTAKEYEVKGGITLEESTQLAKWLEKEGLVALNVSATSKNTRATFNMTWPDGDPMGLPSIAHPYGYLLAEVAAKIKEVVSVPVIGVGRISPEAGEEAIAQGYVDMVAIGRQLFCDPELPNKVAAGDIDAIRPCMSCNECALRAIKSDQTLHCTINPCLGREKELEITPTPKKKRVMVVGGGPAGLEAARVAAMRGHEVTILEKRDRLGGQLIMASMPPYKDGLLKFVDYATNQVKRLGVKIELGKEATLESVKQFNPDAVVLAAGASRKVLNLPGKAGIPVITIEDVLERKAETGETVIIIGGGMVGCEVADFLAEKGKKVSVVEMLDTLAGDMEPVHRGYLLNRLNKRGVTTQIGAKAVAFSEIGVVIESEGGRREFLVGDTIVVATSPKPTADLCDVLRDAVPDVHRVGDCVEPRHITEALLEGYRAGLEI